MSRRRRRGNYNSLFYNNFTYIQYFNRLVSIAISSIKWIGLPDEIDELFMNKTIFLKGSAVFFKDDVVDLYCALPCTYGGNMNIYDIPLERRAYATNGYQVDLNAENSVIIFNNYLRTSMFADLEYFALKLYNITRTIDINVNGQKTPLLILCGENEKLTMENLYMQYEGNSPVIKGYNSNLNPDVIKSIKTDVPYISDKLQTLALQIWNEALTYMGISNTTEMKKERVSNNELESVQGHVLANREARLLPLMIAAKNIKRIFGVDLEPEFHQPALGLEVVPSLENVSRETLGVGRNE